MTTWSTFYNWFLPVVPVTVVWLLGALVAISRWRRHPTVSLLVLLGCLLLLFTSVVGTVFQYWLIQGRVMGSWSGQQFDLVMRLTGWGRTGLSVVGYILLLCAVFSGRIWSGQTYRPGPIDTSLRNPPREPPVDLPRDSDDIQKRQRWS